MNDNGNERALKEYLRPATKEDNLYYALGYATDCDLIEECLAYHIERSDNTESEKEFITTFFHLVHILAIKQDNEEEHTFFHEVNAIDRVGSLLERYETYAEKPLYLVRDMYNQYVVNREEERKLKSRIDSFALFLGQSSEKPCYIIISQFLGTLLLQANESRKLATGNLEEMNVQLKLYEIVDRMTEKITNWPFSEVRGNWKSYYVKPRLIDELRTWVDHNSVETITKSLYRIIGQERAKYGIALFVRLHMERLLAREEGKDTRGANLRNCCIMLGPSGSGKSMASQEVKRIVPKSVPVVSLDASGFTDPAYIGADVMSALSKTKNNLEDQGQSIENAIIFCDEADKVLGAKNNVNSQTVRDQFLTLIQGDDTFRFEGGGKETRQVKISGENISFCFMGTFSKMEEGQRHGTCGFISQDTLQQKINYWDELEKRCGLSHEFLGRISSIIAFSKPTKSDIMRYMKTPQSLYEVETLANNLGIEFSLTKGAMEELAAVTCKSQRGMREIQNTLRGLVENYAFSAKTGKIVISKRMVQEYYRLPYDRLDSDFG